MKPVFKWVPAMGDREAEAVNPRESVGVESIWKAVNGNVETSCSSTLFYSGA